jgi:hypothetical protein
MKIGIALAAYQPRPEFFAAQLASLCQQSYRDWVCCITLDSPLMDCKRQPELAPFFSDVRFHWSENPVRLGHLKNFERATQAVLILGVDAIAYCDQDDIWFPEKLAVQVETLQKLGPGGLVFCDMKLINFDGNIIDERTAWQVERRGVHHCGSFDLLVRNVVPGTGLLMDASLASRYPVIPAAAIYHDHWYPLIASKVGKIEPINLALYAYRIHGENVAGINAYRSFFSHEDKLGLMAKCSAVWSRSRELARAVESQGLSLSLFERWAFLDKWDCGLLLFVRGWISLLSDPALARACWARVCGKLISIFTI